VNRAPQTADVSGAQQRADLQAVGILDEQGHQVAGVTTSAVLA